MSSLVLFEYVWRYCLFVQGQRLIDNSSCSRPPISRRPRSSSAGRTTTRSPSSTLIPSRPNTLLAEPATSVPRELGQVTTSRTFLTILLFSYYHSFSTSVPITGISAFTISVTPKGARTATTYTNGGNGYPMQDTAIFLRSKSSVSDSGVATISVAVSCSSSTFVHWF